MEGVETASLARSRPKPRKAPYPRPTLPVGPVRTGIRMVEQAVANAIYGGRG